MSDDTDHVDDDLAEAVIAIAPVTDRLLVLDFDGVLSPLVDDPDAAALAPGVHDAVLALTELTDVVLLSGRHVDDLAPRVDGLPVTICGGHGTEVRHPDGSREPLFDGSAVGAVLDAVEADVRAALPDEPGWGVERKPASLAVHSRNAADPSAGLPAVRAAMAAHEGDEPGWVVTDGHDVTELRPAGVDKGTALRWFLGRHPGRPPVVLGDDVTDEDAFAVAIEQPGGLAVLVAAEPRESHATLRVTDPSRVVALLDALAAG